jgi:hypothetical protein
MLLPLTAAVDTAVVDTSAAVDRPRLDTSWLGMDPAHASWLGMAPVYTSRLDIAPVHLSRVDTAAISGMAVGGITALARAGYGRTLTASTCGPAIEILRRHFTSLATEVGRRRCDNGKKFVIIAIDTSNPARHATGAGVLHRVRPSRDPRLRSSRLAQGGAAPGRLRSAARFGRVRCDRVVELTSFFLRYVLTNRVEPDK